MIVPQNNAVPVSLVIVNFNAGELLTNCITSALEQVEEIIVVDNASLDNSLAQLRARFPDEPRLHIISNQQNLGFSVACNMGAGIAKEACIFFLNPDCLLAENSAALLFKALTAGSNTAMVGGLLENPDGSEQAGGRRAVPTPWRSFVRAFGLHRFSSRWPSLFYDFHLHKQPLPHEPIEVEAISGACMMIKREALEDVGLWDEDYFLHCEDLDLCMRLRQKQWKILFVPDAPVTHLLGKCSGGNLLFVEWHKHKGMIRFYQKFFHHQYPGVLMWLVVSGVWLHFSLISGHYFFKKITTRNNGDN